MKRCRQCEQEKPVTEFYSHPWFRDGHDNRCIECWGKTMRGRRTTEPPPADHRPKVREETHPRTGMPESLRYD
ncbi:hypothetical protein [Jiella pelagia]|uniref:HNH endonuclease n=1 Tax=Jiella pelagia TaxID=2986949 RepID=A0ABY7C5F2_9HYPH|nr:hypothetical protein [Jiella pelagia]WAP69065.1 hypothetical protein OH818_01640 [Jiella pelagia]